MIANPFEVDVAVPERGEARRQFLERHSLPHNAVIVAFVGNLTQQKRPMVFVNAIERLRKEDALLVLSVGGGNLEKNVSPNLVLALQLAKQVGARIIGIVGKDGGYTAQVADACVIVPTVNPGNITPHSEAFQAVIWHLFVSHPSLKAHQTKWESVAAKP